MISYETSLPWNAAFLQDAEQNPFEVPLQ